MSKKQCTCCGITKPLSKFYMDRQKKDNLSPHCKSCHNVRVKKYKDQNKEKYIEYHREYLRRWREDNPEQNLKNDRNWRKKNPEKHRQYVREHRGRNLEAVRSRVSKWKRENKDKVNALNHKRRALLNGSDGSYTEEEWIDLCNKYNNQCVSCVKRRTLTVDHIVPITKGGSNKIDNIQPLCQSCNSKKSTNIVDYRWLN